MSDTNIVLSVEELIAQSQSMKTLKDEYDAMFTQMVSILNEMNEGWSDNLANNFAGKITTAQKGFSKIVEMLECGENVAKEAAQSMEDINAVMARTISGTFAGLFGTVAGGVAGIGAELGSNLPIDKIKEAWESVGGWNAYKQVLNGITDSELYQGLGKLENTIFGTSYLSEADSILDIGKNIIDGNILNGENITAISNLIDVEGVSNLLGFTDAAPLNMILKGSAKIFGDGQNIESLEDYVIDYAYSMEDMQAAWKQGDYVEAATGTILYSLENSTRVIGDVIVEGVTGTVGGILDITGLDESVPWSEIGNYIEDKTGVDWSNVLPAIGDGISQGYSDMVDAAVEGSGIIADAVGDGLAYVGDALSDAGSAIAGWFGF